MSSKSSKQGVKVQGLKRGKDGLKTFRWSPWSHHPPSSSLPIPLLTPSSSSFSSSSSSFSSHLRHIVWSRDPVVISARVLFTVCPFSNLTSSAHGALFIMRPACQLNPWQFFRFLLPSRNIKTSFSSSFWLFFSAADN